MVIDSPYNRQSVRNGAKPGFAMSTTGTHREAGPANSSHWFPNSLDARHDNDDDPRLHNRTPHIVTSPPSTIPTTTALLGGGRAAMYFHFLYTETLYANAQTLPPSRQLTYTRLRDLHSQRSLTHAHARARAPARVCAHGARNSVPRRCCRDAALPKRVRARASNTIRKYAVAHIDLRASVMVFVCARVRSSAVFAVVRTSQRMRTCAE